MSYIIIQGRGASAPLGVVGTSSCGWDMDCTGGAYCCATPDGRGDCMKWDECKKRVDEVCASNAYKQTPHCLKWTDRENPGWYEELEGPCKDDSQCWPSLACCGEHPNGKYCAPKDMCEKLSSSTGILGGAPTWAYVVGGSVLFVGLVAAFT